MLANPVREFAVPHLRLDLNQEGPGLDGVLVRCTTIGKDPSLRVCDPFAQVGESDLEPFEVIGDLVHVGIRVELVVVNAPRTGPEPASPAGSRHCRRKLAIDHSTILSRG
jgi:hypothetical protein